MLPLKLRKIGNSVGVVFPKEALSKLHAEEGDTVFLSETPDGFRLTSHDPEFEKQMEIAEEGMKSYRNTLRVLAK